MSILALHCELCRRVKATLKNLNHIAGKLGLHMLLSIFALSIDLRDKAEGDLRQVQLADHGVARLIEDMMAGASLRGGVYREQVIVHNHLEVAALVSELALDDLVNKNAGF
jgi:hypothetical protein